MSEPDTPRLRVLLGRPLTEGSSQHSSRWAAALRDAGFEVIVSGAGEAPDAIAHTAVQEDVDVIGLSVRAGSDDTIVAELLAALRKRGADDITVFAGGPLLDADARRIEAIGVARCFKAEAHADEVVELIRTEAQRRRETRER